MVVVNKKAGDDNNSGLIDEIARVNDSNKANLKREMICLYQGKVFEDDNNNGSRVFVSTEAEMIRSIYKETICPMICEEVNRKHQNFLFMVREKFGLDLSTGMTWNFHNMESNLGSRSLQLKFLNGILTPVSTGTSIKGNEQRPFLVALVNEISGQIVTTGAEAAMEVELIVLEGGASDAEADNWTSDEFNNRIVSEWNGQKVLQGNSFVKLNEGIGYVDNLSFTHNSGWKEKRECRIGARSVNADFCTRVKEAKTEVCLVMDKRNLLYCKHEIPSLSDAVFRLHEISHRSELFKRLSTADIKTVMDLLTIHAINPQKIKDILKVNPKKWSIIMDHAKVCKDDKGIYLYHCPSDAQKSKGVAFNINGQLVGIIVEFHFVPCDKLPNEERADAQKLIVSSTEHWKEVVPFTDQDSLINHLQSRTTLNPSSHKSLNVMIPQTTDLHNHTSCFTSPKSQSPKRPASEHAFSKSPKQPRHDHPKSSPSDAQKLIASSSEHWEEGVSFSYQDSLINPLQSHTILDQWSHNNLNVVIPETPDPHNHTNLTSPQSKSPKRPASEHVIPNFGKQLRYDHPRLSPSTPGVGIDTCMNHKANNLELRPEDDVSMYFNELRDGWKILWCAVGWISVILKLRKRRTTSCHHDTFIVIAASIDHAGTFD